MLYFYTFISIGRYNFCINKVTDCFIFIQLLLVAKTLYCCSSYTIIYTGRRYKRCTSWENSFSAGKTLSLFDDNKMKMARKPRKKKKESPLEWTFCFFSGFLAIFISLSSNNTKKSTKYTHNYIKTLNTLGHHTHTQK